MSPLTAEELLRMCKRFEAGSRVDWPTVDIILLVSELKRRLAPAESTPSAEGAEDVAALKNEIETQKLLLAALHHMDAIDAAKDPTREQLERAVCEVTVEYTRERLSQKGHVYQFHDRRWKEVVDEHMANPAFREEYRRIVTAILRTQPPAPQVMVEGADK